MHFHRPPRGRDRANLGPKSRGSPYLYSILPRIFAGHGRVAVLSCLCSIRLALQQVTAAKLRDAARKRKVDGTKVPPSSVTACLAFLQLELCACDRGRRSHAGLNGAEQLNPKQGQCRRDLSSTQTSRGNRLRQELSGSIPVAGLPRKARTLAARTAA